MQGKTHGRERARNRQRGGVPSILAAVLVLLLAGCALRASPSPASPLPTLSPITPSLTPTSPPAVPGPLVTRLRLWVPEDFDPYGESPEAAIMAQQLAEFNQAQTGLQVEAIVKKSQGRGGLLDFLRTASAAAPSVLPDLVVLRVDDLRVAAQGGLLQPLGPLLPEDLAADRFPYAIGMGEVDGQTMGVPIGTEVEHMAYRPALLASPPVTWTAVLSAEVPFVFPAAGQTNGVNDATLVQYLGAGGYLTDGEGNPQLEGGPLTAVLDFYARAEATGVISPTVVLSLSDTEACWDLFQTWQAGMVIVNSRCFWTEADVYAALAPVPTRNGRVAALARGWVLALVSADAERQQQALRLVSWLLDPERHGTWTQAARYLPATRGGLAAWDVSDEERAVLEAMLEAAQPVPPASVRAVVGPPMQAALEAVLEGRRSPAEAAAEAARAVEP
jgi:ABC-type glycerol-3-phosphate transport system substrate-binding protein